MSVAGSFPFAANIAPLFEATPSARRRGVGGIARDIAARAYANAADQDEDGAYPAADVAALHEGGLLAATLPREWGGAGIGALALCEILREIGSGSLPLGRLFEGHVNAIGLVLRYGSREQILLVAREARNGKLSGVWNTDDRDNLRLVSERGGHRLQGRKILASRRPEPGHCSSPGDTIRTATIRRATESRAVQRQLPSLRLYEYTVWGSTLPAATPVEPVNDGFRIWIEQRLTRKRRAIAAHRSQTTDLINDDPNGFRLTDSDLARFDLPYESFFESV